MTTLVNKQGIKTQVTNVKILGEDQYIGFVVNPKYTGETKIFSSKSVLSKVALSEILGTLAFKKGQKRVFAQHNEACKLLTGLEVGNPLNNKIMDAWYKAWDLANLNTLV